MRGRLERICLLIAVVSGLASPLLAQTGPVPVRLRTRTFAPPANVRTVPDPGMPRASGALDGATARRHVLIQFSRPIDQRIVADLRQAGGVPLRFVPENTLAAVVPAGFVPAAVDGARWVGGLQPADRISDETAADLGAAFPAHPLTVVEFHPDVTRAALARLLADVGTIFVDAPALPAHATMIPTDALAIRRLSALDEVAWIYPAPADIEAAAPAAMCAGLVRPEGVVASYAAMGEGWDGPGRGAVSLRYFLSAPSSDLDPAVQSRELVRAMAEWARHAAVTWTPGAGPAEAASVRMLWGPAQHGDSYPFTANVLAHAYYPAPPAPEPIAGDVHFNDDLLWGAGDPRRWDVFSVALHELGHSLGLVHSGDPGSVMYPMSRGIVHGLADIDVRTIQTIYAAPPSPVVPRGWAETVVGADSSGGVSQAEGRFVITAGGRDIWGRADEFRFVARTLRGDGDLVARVDALQGTHRWSKAGLMIRRRGDPGASHAFVLVSRARGLAFQRRLADGGDTLHTEGGPGAAPCWLWLSRRGARIDAYAASDGGEWRLMGSAGVALGDEALAGLAVTNHDVSGSATAVFSSVSVTESVGGAWMSADIGDVGREGAWVEDGARMRVRGAGADIWNSEDAFRFVWRSIEGDVDMIARLERLDSTRPWTKAGVMIRGGLERGAPHAFMLGSAGKGLAFQRRAAAGGATSHTSAGSGAAPRWLKLSRRGNRLTAFHSVDGRQWTLAGSDSIALGPVAFVGLAVSSHTRTATSEALFDGVTVAGAPE